MAKAKKKQQKDDHVVLDMTFDEAMKKALNTPLPKKDTSKKKAPPKKKGRTP